MDKKEENMVEQIKQWLQKYPHERSFLLDMLWEIQEKIGYISEEAISALCEFLNISKVDLLDTISFYHFFHLKPVGQYQIYLNKGIVAQLNGWSEVAKTFEEELGISWGETDGEISLFETSCIGMCDQEPACLINKIPFTHLTPEKVKGLIQQMRNQAPVEDMVSKEEKEDTFPLIHSEVKSKIYKRGPLLLQDFQEGQILEKIYSWSPKEIIEILKDAGLRGRGGAGFPTGLKWQLCNETPAKKRFIICNADEGEPGTFKDRILLTEYPEILFEGMAIAGYAVRAEEGILYLRAEYRYLKQHLEFHLARIQEKGFLQFAEDPSFSFTIRIQVGAGAYVCGEETALIESLEGKRGEPRYRPPFPTNVGYLGLPTVVNNVETFCTVPLILKNGAKWYKSLGTEKSAGTRLLSISGDCEFPGIYEVEWGLSLKELLKLAGAKDPFAIQVGGPSGTLIPATEDEHKIAFEDLATGGAVIIFGKQRNLLSLVQNFMDFFVNESCGCCTPCRAGTVILQDMLNKIIAKKGRPKDLESLKAWGNLIKKTSRCGLGNTSPNPIFHSLEHFPEEYQALIQNQDELFYDFDLPQAEEEYDDTIESLKSEE